MRFKALGAAVVLAIALTGCSSNDDTSTPAPETSAPTSAAAGGTIVDVASGNPDFSTLVTAVTAAGLGSTLTGPGPYTVFAPTNAAFAALPAGVLEKLVLPANNAALTSILTYHVVPGEVKAAQIVPGPVTTAQGSPLTLAVNGAAVTVTDSTGTPANVVVADVDASNGVIHAVDKVLLPPGFDPATLQ